MNMRRRFLLTASFLVLSSFPALSGTVPSTADLSVTKTGPAQAAADTDITYTITVVNNGPDQAGAASMTDNVPANTTFVSFVQNSGGSWSCSSPQVGSGGTISCSNNALPPNSTSIFTLVVHIDSGTGPGTAITNVANVSEPTDPNDENNSSAATTFIPTPESDLGVTKAADSDQALADSDVTYTIQINNFGPDDATNAQWNDTLPQNFNSNDMTFVSLQQTSGPTWSCTTPAANSYGTVVCTLATVPNGSNSTFILKGHIPPGTPSQMIYSNTASVTSSHDPNSENDSSTADVAVVSAAPSLTTQASGGVLLGGSISDTATLSGGQSPTGTISFFAYGPNDNNCGSNPAFASSVSVNDNG